MMNLVNVLILCWAFSVIQGDTNVDPVAIVQHKVRLGKELAKDYDKVVLPGNTTLKIGISFVCAQYDESEKRLYTRVFERYTWTDWRLRWDPSKYGGVENVKVPANMLWTPHDVRLYNTFPDAPARDDVNVLIEHDGTIHWVPSVTYKSLCGHGENKHDRKVHCHLSLGSWTYSADDLPLETVLFGPAEEKAVDTTFYLDDCPHVMSNITFYIKNAKYDCCIETYASLEVDFDLAERDDHKPRGSHDRYERYHKKQRGDRPKIDCKWPNC